MTGPAEDRPLLSELWHSKAWRLFPLLLAYMAGGPKDWAVGGSPGRADAAAATAASAAACSPPELVPSPSLPPLLACRRDAAHTPRAR